MAFQWNVQPYAKLSELRDEYTTTVILATRKQGEALAVEAEQWMKDNAPWQDRPEELRNHLKELDFLPEDAIHAREGLRVIIDGGKEESRERADDLADAQRRDRQLLKQLNEIRAQRRETQSQLVTTLTRAGNRSEAQKQLGRLNRLKQFKPISAVPKGKSHVAALERQQKATQTPIISLTFKHGDERKVPYAVWLEIANQGRYAIISRALDYWAPKFMVEIKRIANLRQYRERIVASESMVQLDQEILQDNRMTPEEKFQRHLARESRYENYQPWTPERQAESRRRSAQPARRRQRAEGRARRRQNRAGYF